MADGLQAHPYTRDLSKLDEDDRALLGGAAGRRAAASTANMPQNHSDHDAEVMAHPVPLWMLFVTFGGLMVLTFLTVAATWFDFGPVNIWIALIIAFAKAVLVAVIFMHLRWDNPFNALALGSTMFFLVLFIGVTCMDTQQVDNAKDPPGGYATESPAVP